MDNKLHKYSRAVCGSIVLAYPAFMMGYESLNIAMGIVWAVLTTALVMFFSITGYDRVNEQSSVCFGLFLISSNIALIYAPDFAVSTIPLGIIGVIDIIHILRTKYKTMDRKSIMKNELKSLLLIAVFIIYILVILYFVDNIS